MSTQPGTIPAVPNGIGDAANAAAGVPSGVVALAQSVQGSAAAVLRPWWVAVAARATRRANALCIGDSITAGYGATAQANRWISCLAVNARLRLGLPAGGRGYLPGANTITGGYPWPVTPAGGATVAPAGSTWGLNHSIVALTAAGQTLTWALNGTTAVIMYLKGTALGTFSYSVDGGAATNVVTTAGSNTDGNLVTVALGAAGPHTLTLAWVSGTNFIDGVFEQNGDETSGIQFHDAGHGGFTSAQWAAMTGGTQTYSWTAAIGALDPDLVIVELGANDAAAAVSPAVYASNIQSMISSMNASLSAPLPPVVFMMQGAPAGPPGGDSAWTNYVEALYGVTGAIPNGAIMLDMRYRMPPADANPNYGIYFDSVHPNNTGHELIADALVNAILPN